jgi:acyl-CoA synthetase (AMP-forming)/AMP-acid ligase II
MIMGHTKFVHTFLEESAARFPDKKALFASGRWHTFLELELQANKLACLLLSRGLTKNNRVAILLENSSEYVASYYAVLKAEIGRASCRERV